MADLLAPDGTLVPLRAHHRVGRSPACDLTLPDPRVSGEHALLTWRDGVWTVRDLGSRNGTAVDGRRLEPGREQPVDPHTRLTFGCEDQQWMLHDNEPPQLFASSHTGQVVRGADRMLLLPDDTPLAAVSESDAGGFVLEQAGEEQPIEDRQVVDIGGTRWQIHLPASLPSTQDAGWTLERLSLQFDVSVDEEYVEITLISGPRREPLKPRAHHYLVLTLARRHLDDQAAGTEPAQCGWVTQPELMRMLRVTDNYVNVAVWRFRKEVAAAGVTGSARIIERRPGTRQLRMALPRLEVRRIGDDAGSAAEA